VTTQIADTAVRTAIVVDAPQQLAFDVFTQDMGGWWPPDHHILEGELAESEMRFYRAGTNHHDLALVQVGKPDEVAPPPEDWLGFFPDHAVGINHFAIGYPTREAWLHQLEHLQAMGVPFDLRGNHGMTHSVYVRDPDGNSVEILYDLPPEVWSGDVNAALNYFEVLPGEGAGALEDDTEYHRFDPADA